MANVEAGQVINVDWVEITRFEVRDWPRLCEENSLILKET